MDPNPDTPHTTPSPPLLNYILGFLLVGAAWGLTTPFMRRAAVNSASASSAKPPSRAWLDSPSAPWLKKKVWGVAYAVWDVLRNPAYAIPLVINLTGSVWFFLLIGQAGEFFFSFCVNYSAVVGVMGSGQQIECLLMAYHRTQSYGADHEFSGFLIHGIGRVVGREEGHHKRYA